MCPLATKSCPLARNEWPAQKGFPPVCVAAVFVFVDGSQSVGLSPTPNWGQYSTLPVGSTLAWTACHVQVMTGEYCPTVPGSWALADETAIKCATAKQGSATKPSLSRSEERE